eukprot:3739647-Rhodomonas_salina.1
MGHTLQLMIRMTCSGKGRVPLPLRRPYPPRHPARYPFLGFSCWIQLVALLSQTRPQNPGSGPGVKPVVTPGPGPRRDLGFELDLAVTGTHSILRRHDPTGNCAGGTGAEGGGVEQEREDGRGARVEVREARGA